MTDALKHYDPYIHAVQEHTGMKPYLVGGAVRDALIGRKSKDIDLVQIGGKDKLEAQGWKATGKDFPVYRHPEHPNVELAVARGEKKVGKGYTGFNWYPAKDLKTDLERRDLTINAMAYHPDDGVIDHHGGVHDLHSKTLRHVSPAFAEDPLRTFRVARFAAQLGFKAHPHTVELMKGLSNEMPDLTRERVRGEMEKAMVAPHPHRFFDTLRSANSLHHWMPELHNQIGKETTVKHDTDRYTHTMSALSHAAKKGFAIKSKEFVLTQMMGSDGAKSFGQRFGYKKQQIREWMTHSQHHTTPFVKLKAHETVDYWRQVKAIAVPHLEAAAATHHGDPGVPKPHLQRY